jgi:RsiW-degrading membrane proteinase PrsW (M82 family)
LEQFLGVGFVEELFKMLGLVFIAFKAPYFLKTKKGTLTIAILSAIIFTVIEDLYYVTALGATVFDRLPFFPVHMLWTGIAAYGVSIAVIQTRTEPGMKRSFLKAYLTEGPIALLSIAVLLHAAFDFFAFDITMTIAVFALSIIVFIQAYRHFPEKLTSYRYLGAKSMLKSLIGLSPR